MIGVVMFVILIFGAVVLIVRRKKPNPGTALVVQPGRKFNRLQQLGLTYAAMGIVFTLGIQIVNHFHPMSSHFRAGQLGYSEGLILVGVAAFVVGWRYRRKPESPKTK